MENYVQEQKINSPKIRTVGVLLGNVILAILELIAIIQMIPTNKWRCFAFYTDISNALTFIVSIILIVTCIVVLCKRGGRLPQWVMVLKYITVCMLFITFIVVVSILAPYFGKDGYITFLFKDSMLFTHTICPIYALVSSLVFERGYVYKFIYTIYALIPTLIYGITLIVLNVLKVIEGPYPFFFVYVNGWFKSVVWIIGVILGTYLLSVIVWFGLQKRTQKTKITRHAH